MSLSRLKQKLISFYTLFVAPPKEWWFPRKSEVLIYDACGEDALRPYLTKYRVTTMAVRGELVNVPCLLRSALTLTFWRGKPLRAYTDTYIRAVAPKVIITFIDNSSNFYCLARQFPNAKTVFLQNGVRSTIGDVFESIVKSDNYHVDNMLVFGGAIGKKYNAYVSGSVTAIGSLKNNTVSISRDIIDKAVLFISQYRDQPAKGTPFLTSTNGQAILHSEFYSAEVGVLDFLRKWCLQNEMHLKICGVSSESNGAEYDFYKNILGNYMWEYLPRSGQYSSYNLVDTAHIVVAINSTLGYESIARGKKTAMFACRHLLGFDDSQTFGWPAELPTNGPFWTNDNDIKQFQRVMDYLNRVSNKDWDDERRRYATELIQFDEGNTRLRALLDQLLPTPLYLAGSSNSNHDGCLKDFAS